MNRTLNGNYDNHPDICDGCGKSHPIWFTVKDPLWKKYYGDINLWLCVGCFERNLGRKLKRKDLKDTKLNRRLLESRPDL